MSAGGHVVSDDWPDYIIRPEVVFEPVRRAIPVAHAAAPPASPGALSVLAAIAIVLGLAAAAAWFVGVPHLTKTAPVHRGCEVIVLKSGKTKCVTNPRAAWKARAQGKPAKR
jgi:hypothetical protein